MGAVVGGGWVGSLCSTTIAVDAGVGAAAGAARVCATRKGEASSVAVPPQATASAVAETAIANKILRTEMVIGGYSNRISAVELRLSPQPGAGTIRLDSETQAAARGDK